MTIQQYATFDSGLAKLNATSKLVKAWESKNAKKAAKASGLTLMAVSLSACGGSDDVVVDITSDNDAILLAAVTAVDATAATVAEVATNANAAGVTTGAEAADAAILQSIVDAGITVADDATSAELIAAIAASIPPVAWPAAFWNTVTSSSPAAIDASASAVASTLPISTSSMLIPACLNA